MCEDFGNPSSLYRLGLNAERIVKAARAELAKSIGAESAEIIFTSGGTESDNAAINGVWRSRSKRGRRIITTRVEHPAVLRVCEALAEQGADVVYLPVLSDGSFDMEAYKAALSGDTVLVSVMYVNNETGAVMPVTEIARLAREASENVLVHTDAVQAYGKLDCSVSAPGADLMSLSAHKVRGPKGVGALYVRKGLHLPAFVLGGGQENAMRSGTENVPGIAGFGAAAALISEHGRRDAGRMAEVKAELKRLIFENIEDVRLNGPEDGAPSILNISFLGCRSEVLLRMLEQEEIYVSSGAACSSKKKSSHVLAAMGLGGAEAEGAVRFSFGPENSVEEMAFVVEKLAAAVESQRKLTRFRR